MLNPPEQSIGRNGSTCGDNDVTRYRINLETGLISASTFPNPMNSIYARYMDKYDFPTINEAYRGKQVRFLMNCLNINNIFNSYIILSNIFWLYSIVLFMAGVPLTTQEQL